MQGDYYVERILAIIDGMKMSGHERELCDHYLSGCLQYIYGNSFDRERVMTKYGFDDVRDEMVIYCPRRTGKTHSLCCFVMALSTVVPDTNICVFSVSKRHMYAFRNQVCDLLGVCEDEFGDIVLENGSIINCLSSPKSGAWRIDSLYFIDDLEEQEYPWVFSQLSGTKISVSTLRDGKVRQLLDASGMFCKDLNMRCLHCIENGKRGCEHKYDYFRWSMDFMTPRQIRQQWNKWSNSSI